MSVDTEAAPEPSASRELPAQIVIPPIRGEMLHLKPATMDDLPLLDDIDAYYNAAVITGKDQQSERALVHAWVSHSVAWSQGLSSDPGDVFDTQSRATIAWSILTDVNVRDIDETSTASGADHAGPRIPRGSDDSTVGLTTVGLKGGLAAGGVPAEDGCKVIGMIFLIDIDPWARSARIQVILGKDYRGRGYSRDAMPRVMTYGFAPGHVGLDMHRIWVTVPSINTRSLSVYKSLGFVQSGAARDAMWDAQNNKYQDLIVMDTLADEYDPLRSLDAFGMHVFEDNPGVTEAIEAHEQQQSHRHVVRTKGSDPSRHEGDAARPHASHGAEGEQSRSVPPVGTPSNPAVEKTAGLQQDHHPQEGPASGGDPAAGQATTPEAPGGTGLWPFNGNSGKNSKRAWWRNLGRNGKRDTEERQS